MIKYVLSIFSALVCYFVGVPLNVCFSETDDIGKVFLHLIDACVVFEAFIVVANAVGILEN